MAARRRCIISRTPKHAESSGIPLADSHAYRQVVADRKPDPLSAMQYLCNPASIGHRSVMEPANGGSVAAGKGQVSHARYSRTLAFRSFRPFTQYHAGAGYRLHY